MKLFKPEYNENVVDVDSLEKLRIQQEGESERNLILQQELTKREAIKQREDTKRGSGYTNLRSMFIWAGAIVMVVSAISAAYSANSYIELLHFRVEATRPPAPKCPDVPECPKLTCAPVRTN